MTEGPEEPLYRQIAADLRGRIATGEYSPTGKLPGEKVLAAQWETSTATASNALKLLAREGVIEIRRGAGSFVRNRNPILRNANARLSKSQWGEGKAIWQVDLGDHYPVPETEVYRSGEKGAPEVPDVVREHLPAETYLIRDRRYTVDGQPVQLSRSYFDYDLVKGTRIEKRDSGPGGVYNRLLDLGYEVKDPDEFVRGRNPTEDEAKRLRITTDRPVVEIVRLAATEEGKLLEVNVMVLVGDAYVLQYKVTT